MNILHPQIAWDGYGPGYTESEFQIYGYLIALYYKILGYWEPAGRIISFLFSLATMLVFFRLSRYLLDRRKAIVTSLFFALSPILMVMSVAIQPESTMFFFYILSAYFFIKWINEESKLHYWLAILFTTLALLCKITAANIGLFFILLILFKKGWTYLFNKYVVLFGILSLIPSIIWYRYSHQFYILYGNSLGISNEHSWIGWDFITNRQYIENLVTIELHNVWTYSGAVILFIGFIFTKVLKNESAQIGIFWFASALIFYLIAVRTTSQDWAYYYHIFSIPAASILLGNAIVEIFDRYFRHFSFNHLVFNYLKIKSVSLVLLTCILILSTLFSSFKFLIKSKPYYFHTSEFYYCKDSLQKIIPKNSILLASGGYERGTAGHLQAYNSSYFFYWLNLKGYNISVESQSIENVLDFSKRGAKFFLAEERMLRLKPGFEEDLKERFPIIYQSNGCILFKI